MTKIEWPWLEEGCAILFQIFPKNSALRWVSWLFLWIARQNVRANLLFTASSPWREDKNEVEGEGEEKNTKFRNNGGSQLPDLRREMRLKIFMPHSSYDGFSGPRRPVTQTAVGMLLCSQLSAAVMNVGVSLQEL